MGPESFRYIPPKTGNVALSDVNITDRSPEGTIDLLGLVDLKIKSGDSIVIAGGGLCFSFEQYLKAKGARVTTIDQSLSFTSRDFIVAAFDGLFIKQGHTAKYFRKIDKADIISKDLYRDEDFRFFQRQRWEVARRTCDLVIGGTLPQIRMADYIRAKFIFDLYGPAYYVSPFEMRKYIEDIIKTLAPGGMAAIYSLGFSRDLLDNNINNWGPILENRDIIDCKPLGFKGITIQKKQ